MQWKMQKFKSLNIWVTCLIKLIYYIICLKQLNERHNYCFMGYLYLLNILIITILQISICLVYYIYLLPSGKWLKLILVKCVSLPSSLYKTLNTFITAVRPKEFKSALFKFIILSTLPAIYKI